MTDDNIDDLKHRIQTIAYNAGVPFDEVREKFKKLESYRVPRDEIERSVRAAYDIKKEMPPPSGLIVDPTTLEDGAAIAVQTEPGQYSRYFSAVVAGRLSLSDDPSEGCVAIIKKPDAWRWTPDAPKSVEQYKIVDDRGPPKVVRNGFKKEYNTSPQLNITDGRLELLELSPIWNHKGVENYSGHPVGPLSEIKTGAIVDPTALLP
jgi:hypothetical protein